MENRQALSQKTKTTGVFSLMGALVAQDRKSCPIASNVTVGPGGVVVNGNMSRSAFLKTFCRDESKDAT